MKAIEEASEPADEAYLRRMRESQRVEERVKYIYNVEDWHRELAKVWNLRFHVLCTLAPPISLDRICPFNSVSASDIDN